MKFEEYIKKYPDSRGFYGPYGGSFVDKNLAKAFKELDEMYEKLHGSQTFVNELNNLRKTFQGRPTPIYYCENLSRVCDGAQIYLKREDLGMGASHKLNHALGLVLIAKLLGKKKVIAETGSGQHGLAVAISCSKFGLEPEIHMGELDIKRQRSSVNKMKFLGAKIVCVDNGDKSLKASYDSAMKSYSNSYKTSFYCPGSAIGPHPLPRIVRDLQLVVGLEAQKEFKSIFSVNPDVVIASVSGGSNSVGFFLPFLGKARRIIGVQALGKSKKLGENAASLTFGEEGVMQGYNTLYIKTKDGSPAKVYSIAAGMNYPAVGPELALLKDLNLIEYENISDKEAIEAFFLLTKHEGIIPSLEASHALALAIKLSKSKEEKGTILVNLSGSGDKDLDYIFQKYEDNFLKNIE